MCEFVSWLELDGKGDSPNIKFLTTDLIPKALELGMDLRDLAGHEAIRRVYRMERTEGVDRECTDFSTPSNFPPEIVKALLQGRMTGFGALPPGILSNLLDEEYFAKRKPLGDEYWAKLKPLDEEYFAKRKPLGDEYWAKLKPLDEEYFAKRKLLYDEYWAKRKPLDEEYFAKRKLLYDEYWGLVPNPANRSEAWREVN